MDRNVVTSSAQDSRDLYEFNIADFDLGGLDD